MHRDAHRIIVPTLWGYATLAREPDAAHPFDGTTRRTDTVLPPELSAEQLREFHAQLLLRPADRRRTRTAAAAIGQHDLLRRAVDVRTTCAFALLTASTGASPHDVAFAGLARAMRRACDADLTEHQEALARQVAWCGILAAHDNRLASVLDATRALHHLTETRSGH